MAFGVPLLTSLLIAGGTAAATAAVSSLTKPKAVQAAPTMQRNQAAERAALSDNLSKRAGQRANRRTPYGGAEAATGAKTSLLGRS